MATSQNTAELEIIIKARDEATATVKQVESSVIRFVGAVSSLLSIFGTLVFPVKAAAEFQRELLNVAKTTDFTETQINQLRRSLIELSTRIDLTATDLAKIAAIAGQLGLGSSGVKGIAQFTETTARFASVINISVEEAANGLAKMLNIFKVSVTEVERIASLLNELSNNSTASGAELIDIVQRIGTAGGTLGIKQAAALAALGRDVGLTVETVGTSFQKVFLDLQTKADKIAPLIGIPVEQFSKTLKEDGISALRQYLTALSRLPPATRAAFAEETTGGGRVFGLVTNLINDAENGFKLLDARLKNAEEGFDGGTSAIREQQRVMQGLLKQLALVRNGFLNLAEEAGRRAIPAITDLARKFQELLRDPATVDRIVQVATVIGNMALGFVRAIETLAGFSDVFGPLLRLLQIFIGFKVVGYLFDLGRGFIVAANNARQATQAFLALATGQAKLAAASQATSRAVAASAVQLSPLVGSLGQAIGAAPAAQRARQAAAVEAENIKFREQVALNQLIATEAAKITLFKQESAAANVRVAALDAEILRLKQGQAATMGLSLRQLQAQRREQLALIQTNAINIAETTRAASTAIRAQRQVVDQAKLASVAASSTAIAGTFGALLTGVQNFFATAVSMVARLGRGLFAAIFGPIGLAITLVASLIEMFIGFDKVLEFFARLVGFSNTARQRVEQDARLRAQALEIERDEINALAAEYDRLSDKISSFRDSQRDQAITAGDLTTFLAQANKEIGLIQAKMQAVSLRISETATNQSIINQRLETQEDALIRQLVVVTKLQERFAELSAERAKDPNAGFSVEFISVSQQLEVARSKAQELREETERLRLASISLGKDKEAAQKQIPVLLDQERERLQSIAPLYDQQAALLLQRAAAIAEQREKLEQLGQQIDLLRQKGAETGTDEKQRADFLLLEQKAIEVRAQLQGMVRDFNALRQSSSIAANVLVDSFNTDILKVKSAEIQRTASVLSAALLGQAEGLQRQSAIAQQEVARLEVALQKLNQRRSEVLNERFLTEGRRTNAIAEVNNEVLAAQRQLGVARARQQNLQQQLALAQQLAQQGRDTTVATAATQRAEASLVVTLGTRRVLLQAVERAQTALAAAARGTADTFKQEYERAANAAAAAMQKAADKIADLQETLRSRADRIKLAQFDAAAERNARLAQRINEQALTIFRKHLETQGLSAEQIERAVQAYQDQLEAAEELRKQQTEIMRAQVEYQTALNAANSAQERINTLQEEQAKLVMDIKAAQERGDDRAVRELTDKLNQARTNSQAALKVLEEAQAKLIEIGNKVISGGVFTNPQVAVAADRVKQDVEKINQTIVTAAAKDAAAMKVVADSAEQIAVKMSAALTQTKNDLTELDKNIKNLEAAIPALAGQFDKIGAAIIKQTPQLQKVIDTANAIAALDFSRAVSLPDVAKFEVDLNNAKTAITAFAKEFSDKIVNQFLTTGEASRRSVVQQIIDAFSLKIDAAALQKAVSTAATAQEVQINNIGFPTARESLLKQFQKPIDIPVNLVPQGGPGNVQVQGRASGGMIYGAGTSTSDSILARLSHGEYVNDARTVRAFGGGSFFAFLKSIANRGSGAVTSFLMSMSGGLPLPRFATGGPVDFGSLAKDAASIVSPGGFETVRLELAVGGKEVELFGERDQIKTFVRSLRNIGRGT
jgi:TP901 family phage tail tape measure protein